MSNPQSCSKRHTCIANVGLFRSGTTTLTEAAKCLGMKAYRDFPGLQQDQLNEFLHKPEKAVTDWASRGGFQEIVSVATSHDIICDGWAALLPLLPTEMLESLVAEARESGVDFIFVATVRDVESTVMSELQHWTIYDLERKAGLSNSEKKQLEHSLRERALRHSKRIQVLLETEKLLDLPLVDYITVSWPQKLSQITDFTKRDWSDALHSTGKQNANPRRPIEGILITLRLGKHEESYAAIDCIDRLLDQIEEDRLCSYMVVLGIDEDEADGDAAATITGRLQRRAATRQQLQSIHTSVNSASGDDQLFHLCSVWNEMATVAWQNGADWVVLLGDDIEVKCSYHYRAIYRSFLDISEGHGVPFGFGCPWWNDVSFPGFPTFPCVGKTHFEIYGGLVPKNRRSTFINQDLDPYLHRLYQKFRASPCVQDAVLANTTGGNIGSMEVARYDRISAKGWRDFAAEDTKPIQKYLEKYGTVKETILLDVVVPSYRVRLDYLQSICSLRVPEYMRTLFIIIVDNPDTLMRVAASRDQRDNVSNHLTLGEAERILEESLSNGGNSIRVRCNQTNVGASASRNRGLDESAAEFVLNLDDDLIPNPDLLEQYGQKLVEIGSNRDIVGLIGLVRFPRSPNLPLKHAAVLMSYLTFMFEIAERNDLYKSNSGDKRCVTPVGPAWGVTANILFRRTKVRFDKVYAKTGGGEDVDFSLRVAAESGGKGILIPVPDACVVHPFWPGSAFTLASHFFNWAIGDGALFIRFPKNCYWSFPNVVETLLLISPAVLWINGPWKLLRVISGFVMADLVVDLSYRGEYKHRCRLLEPKQGIIDTKDPSLLEYRRSRWFYLLSHGLANLYVIVLECGRLWGHIVTRKDPFRGFCRRFDWHCGRLEKAPSNFRKREAWKFSLFLGILLYEFPVIFHSIRHHWQANTGGACDSNTLMTCNISNMNISAWKDVVLNMIGRN